MLFYAGTTTQKHIKEQLLRILLPDTATCLPYNQLQGRRTCDTANALTENRRQYSVKKCIGYSIDEKVAHKSTYISENLENVLFGR